MTGIYVPHSGLEGLKGLSKVKYLSEMDFREEDDDIIFNNQQQSTYIFPD